MATITVKINDDNFIKIQVGSDFRFVEGTEENLVVSDQGQVLKRYPRSCRYGGRKSYYQVVTPKPNTAGYLQVNVPIRNTTTLVHRLVAETFLSNPKGYNEIDHVNRDKTDNSVTNLRWCTHKANMSNISKYTEKTYYRDITAVDLDTGKEYRFEKMSDILPLAQERGWGKGWSMPIRRRLDQKGGVAYGYFWTAKTRETKNIG